MNAFQLTTGLIFRTTADVVVAQNGVAFNSAFYYSDKEGTTNLSGILSTMDGKTVAEAIKNFTFKASSIVASWTE